MVDAKELTPIQNADRVRSRLESMQATLIGDGVGNGSPLMENVAAALDSAKAVQKFLENLKSSIDEAEVNR